MTRPKADIDWNKVDSLLEAGCAGAGSNEIPRLPGGRTHIENNYLKKIEREAREAGVETNY